MQDNNEFTRNKKKVFLVFILVLNVLILTDPEILHKYFNHINGTMLAVINITSISVLGFLTTTIAPDLYMDREYRTTAKEHYGLGLIARAIHTLGFCIIFATAIYTFYN